MNKKMATYRRRASDTATPNELYFIVAMVASFAIGVMSLAVVMA